MKIHIPNSAFLGNIDPFLRGFQTHYPQKLEITANKKWISVHPVVLAMIAALGLRVKPSHIKCEKFEARSKHYFERMKFFKMLSIPSDIRIKTHEATGKFIPLTQIKNSTELTKFMTEMIPLLHLGKKHTESIRYIISELVRNALEHSGSKDGAIVAAQYHKKSNTVRIGIVDTGVGIKTTINFSHNTKSDLEAIRLSLIPGITGTTKKEGGTETNAGAGLFFIKSIANVNRDHFMLYSGRAMFKLLKSKISSRFKLHVDPFADRYSSHEELPFWKGTVVGIDLSLSKTSEFSQLLDLVWDTYKEAIRHRKKEKYKRARFI